MNDPYRPPVAELTESPSKGKAPWFAVSIAVLFDHVATFIATILVGVAMAIGGAQIDEQAAGSLYDTWSNAMIVIGGAISVLAGFLCAALVRVRVLQWTALAGAITTAIGSVIGGGITEPLRDLSLMLLTVLATIGGGLIWRTSNRAKHPAD